MQRRAKTKRRENEKKGRLKATGYYWARLPLPATAPPNLPNCLPSPDLGFVAGGSAFPPPPLPPPPGDSFAFPDGPPLTTILPPVPPAVTPSGPLDVPTSPAPSPPPPPLPPKRKFSSKSPAPIRCRRRARSWTVRNFSSSSPQRMMPSSRPLRRLGRSKEGTLGVVAFL